MLILMLQRKKVSPKGLTFVRRAASSTTSLAVRLVALWVKGTLIGFCLSPSYGTFASAIYLVIRIVFWPVGLSFVITLFIIINFRFVALFRFYVMNGIDA